MYIVQGCRHAVHTSQYCIQVGSVILECFSCPDFIHPNTQRKVLSDLTSSTNTDPSLASSGEELKLSFREIFSQEHFCCNSVHASFKGVALVMCYCFTKSCYIIIMSDSKFVKIDQYYVKCFFFALEKSKRTTFLQFCSQATQYLTL